MTGRDLGPERGAPYGSDLRLYAGAGIPTLHYGPGSPREAHGPDESVPIEELVVAQRCGSLELGPQGRAMIRSASSIRVSYGAKTLPAAFSSNRRTSSRP